jgi:hypothetical protein
LDWVALKLVNVNNGSFFSFFEVHLDFTHHCFLYSNTCVACF